MIQFPCTQLNSKSVSPPHCTYRAQHQLCGLTIFQVIAVATENTKLYGSFDRYNNISSPNAVVSVYIRVFKESALRPILSSSCDVSLYICVYICMSPPHAIFFEASHWSSDHMIRSRPLIGQPSLREIRQGSGSCV